MGLYTYNGTLLARNGQLANNQNCCCSGCCCEPDGYGGYTPGQQKTQAECESVGGIWYPGPCDCPPPPEGCCCIRDPVTGKPLQAGTITTEQECLALGGSWTNGMSCEDANCVPGCCCKLDERFLPQPDPNIWTRGECEGQGGTWYPGVWCEESPDCPARDCAEDLNIPCLDPCKCCIVTSCDDPPPLPQVNVESFSSNAGQNNGQNELCGVEWCRVNCANNPEDPADCVDDIYAPWHSTAQLTATIPCEDPPTDPRQDPGRTLLIFSYRTGFVKYTSNMPLNCQDPVCTREYTGIINVDQCNPQGGQLTTSPPNDPPNPFCGCADLTLLGDPTVTINFAP